MSVLKEKILCRIASEGPITVAQYMEMALYDPEHGYYMKGDPFGAKGDFITAPEVSQIFGELIGLWFVQAWEDRGRPDCFSFVELGPGRGTLMADMLRAAKMRPEFLDAAKIFLVETSSALRAIQQQTLKGLSIRWCESLAKVGHDAPLFLVANEFLDALPINQFVKTGDGWHERMIASKDGNLFFVLSDKATVSQFGAATIGSIFEQCTIAAEVVGDIASRTAKSGGAALFIDYGHGEAGFGDTLQAVKQHKYADLFAEPGEVDLTSHVDFEALSNIARAADTYVFGPAPQGAFLKALGIDARAKKLKETVDAETRKAIDNAVERLTSPSQMGHLFKVMAVAASGSSPLPAFS